MACLKMICKHFLIDYAEASDEIPNLYLSRSGISIKALEECAKRLGFNTLVTFTNFNDIKARIPLPAIVFVDQCHFVVVYKTTTKYVYVADPAYGKIRYKQSEFDNKWNIEDNKGYIIVLEPQKLLKLSKSKHAKLEICNVIKNFIQNYKKQLIVISFLLVLSSIIEFVSPFFTQEVVDKGLRIRNINIVCVLLIGQLVLSVNAICIELYRNWVSIHVGCEMNITMISNFLDRILSLPLRFFSSKNTGDIIERINDHGRVQEFLTKEFLQSIFAFFSVVICSVILLYFNFFVFITLALCVCVELFWIFNYLEIMKRIDYKNFSLQSIDQNMLFESVNSILDIKLNNLEKQTRNQWKKIQIGISNNNISKLRVEQKYECYRFIDYIQYILITAICATEIIDKQMTIGTYFSIMMIIGALNQPISQLINFTLKYKLTKVSLDRIMEIFHKKIEENSEKENQNIQASDIVLSHLYFSYDGIDTVLKDICLTIPKNKTTAIVGLSGSGKTTLLKLLLKFYQNYSGTITIGNENLKEVNNYLWRSKCGAIMQESSIFSESILYNVTLSQAPDLNRFWNALHLANIDDFVNKLAIKEKTKIGILGMDLSQGQRQRILLARVFYKNPDYIFFDEATNALDTENEKIIMNNILSHFKNKTKIIVAHRLSTVKDADKIIVIHDGKVSETGKHKELVQQRGKYYKLIQNQLELNI